MITKEKFVILVSLFTLLLLLVLPSTAEEPRGNGVIVAGNTWGTYRPPNLPNGFPRQRYIDDFKERGDNFERNGNWIFYQSRFVTSQLFGNPAFSWPFGKNIVDVWGGTMAATVYDPSDEFAQANARTFKTPPLNPEELHYSYLKYNTKIPGAGDPARDYVRPAGGGAYFEDPNTRGKVLYEAGWPTNMGIDVKLRVISLTTPWGYLDDNHLVEIEFYNTGEADIDGDGVVDLSNHRVESLALLYSGIPWYMVMLPNGRRAYNVNSGGYRAWAHDATPDENGAPWAYTLNAWGAKDRDNEDDPGMGRGGWYNDIAYGYTFVGAVRVDDNGNVLGEKMLAFKNSSGEEVVPPVGKGERRGWFITNTLTEARPSPNGAYGRHIIACGEFFVDGGKGRSRESLDLNPNPALFVSGEAGNLTTFVVKDDPATWQYPDGAFEMVNPISVFKGINLPGPNPIANIGGRPLYPDELHAGATAEPNFTDESAAGCGPFALDVGERIRVYFVRAQGFRLKQLRGAIRAGRAMYESVLMHGDVIDPGAPPVPDIKVTGSKNVKPLIMFAPVEGADGYKIYRSKAWPPYDPLKDGLPYEGVYWKTMTPRERPAPDPISPMLKDVSRVRPQSGEHWGPYELIKVIPNDQLENFANPRLEDAKKYPYAYEDNEDKFTLPGQTFFYYVAAYKNERPPAPYDKLEDASITWIESGKVNVNGRDGLWKNSWPFTPLHSFFPKETDIEGLKAIGAAFVLTSPPASVADLEADRVNIVVRPNPYKRLAFHDVGAEHKILFANLPARATITILDLSGQIIDRIKYEAPNVQNGTFFWDMFSKDGTEVASGVYIWVVEHERGVEKGILSILR